MTPPSFSLQENALNVLQGPYVCMKRYNIVWIRLKEDDPLEVPSLEESEDGQYSGIEAYLRLTNLINERQNLITEKIIQLERIRRGMGKVTNTWEHLYKKATYQEWNEACERMKQDGV